MIARISVLNLCLIHSLLLVQLLEIQELIFYQDVQGVYLWIWVEIYDHEVAYYQFKRLCKAFVSSFHCSLAKNYQLRSWLHSSTTFRYLLYFTIILSYSMGCWSPGRITSSLSVSFMASKAYHLSHWSNSL